MTISVEEPALAEAPPVSNGNAPEPKADEYASFDDLISKPAREKDVIIGAGGKTLKVHLRAIGHVEYDRLQATCPPTEEGKKQGLIYDDNTFGPKLISAVVTRPKMDLDRASRLWSDPNWAGGEIAGLYRKCIEICQVGLDVPFTESG